MNAGASVTPEDDAQAVDRVSPATARALRCAMGRLLGGAPQRTDGRLIKDNLWKEAGVSRATMNRAPALLAEWDAAVAATGGFTAGEARRDAEIDRLRRTLTAKNAECTRLQRQLDAAVTAIAALHHDNAALRDEMGRRHGAVVVPMRPRHS